MGEYISQDPFVRGLPHKTKEFDIRDAPGHDAFGSVGWTRFIPSVDSKPRRAVELSMTKLHRCSVPNYISPVPFDLSPDPIALPIVPGDQPQTSESWTVQDQGLRYPKNAPMPTVKGHHVDSKSAMASRVSANMGAENISDPPKAPRNRMPETTTEIHQLVTQDAPTGDNTPSSEPPTVGTPEPLQTEIGMTSSVKPQDIILAPSVYPVDNTLIKDPPLVSQSGAGGNALEASTNLDVARRVLSTWLQKKSPFTTRQTTANTMINPLNQLQDDRAHDYPLYVDSMIFLKVEIDKLKKLLREEQEKTAKNKSAMDDLERQHRENEKQQQDKTRNDLKNLDMNYAAHQRIQIAKHDLIRQNIQAEHQVQLGKIVTELDTLRMENADLKYSIDDHLTMNEAVTLQKDTLKTNLAELREEMDQVQRDATAARVASVRWHQSFLKAEEEREAKNNECRALRSDLANITRENGILRQEVECLRRQDSKHKIDQMRWKEVEEKRKKQKAVKRKEEEKRKAEEAKREEEKKLQEEERRREQERLRVEEEKRRAEVERERQAREAAVKEELAHRNAVAAEEERCRKRDSQRWGYKPWTPDAALERFHIIMAEFSAAKYTPMEPVTIQSIPWPTLLKPDAFAFEAITWENVEAFLRHMKRVSPSDMYAKHLKQVQLMFHPDRWCSRNILSAIVDTKLQEALKDAGGVVSQAVNQWIDKNGGGKRATC